MKLLIASDIHGSIYYANKVIEAFHLHHCDQLLLLGDLLYHGPRNPLPKDYSPKDVIPLLNTYKDKIIAVRGNCDAEVDQMVLAFNISKDYEIIEMDNYQIFATHGHIYHLDKMPSLQENDVFMFGHIHIPMMEKQNGIHIVNPGSITLPKENTHHSYGVIDDNVFTLYDDTHTLLQSYALKSTSR